MQTPNMETPVPKCLELSSYGIRMLSKFPANVVLTTLAAELTAAKIHLGTAQQEYENAVLEILPARVDVKYENHSSDRRVRLSQQKVEMADGKKGGRISGLVFPDGSTPITRLLGDSQIQAMADLEGRLESSVTIWPDAATEKAEIAQCRAAYTTALQYRKNVGQDVRNKRALRNAAKEAFITKYAQIASRVAAEFPRDTPMQDLFFDEVRAKTALAEADDDDENGTSSEPVGGETKTG
jgi:hypothetical protein